MQKLPAYRCEHESIDDFRLRQAANWQDRARKTIARINQPNRMRKIRRLLRMIGIKVKEPL